MLFWRLPHNPTAYDDAWEDLPAQGFFHQWIPGAVLPLVIGYFGVHAIITKLTHFGDTPSAEFREMDAIAFGAAWVSGALFIHFHYFWGNVFNQAWIAVLGKIIAACGFIVAMAVVLVRNGVYGL